MPVCDVCEEEVEKVYTCRDCEARFCEDCGNPREMLCTWCIEED